MKLALVVPALNEEETVRALVEAGRTLGHVIVVDDGSTDRTAEAAREVGATVVRHASNQGYDRALESGFTAAGELGVGAIVTLDADGQHHLDDVGAVSAPVVEGRMQLVLGRRPETARWSEEAFNRYTRWRFGVPDILCGIKAFSIELYRRHERVLGRPSIGTGLALAGLRDGVSHLSVEVSVLPRRGPSRFGHGLRADRRILAALGAAVIEDLRRPRGS